MSRSLRSLVLPMLAAVWFAAGCGDETVRLEWPGSRTAAEPEQSDARPMPPANDPREAVDDLPDSALSRGRFLIAARSLKNDFFARSVVLLLDYSPTGAVGVIVNRPIPVGLSHLLPALESIPERLDRVHLGGPVEPDRMVFLIRSESAPRDSWPVFADVHATGSARALRAAIERDESPARFHAYVDYAGWSPGQLDDEVARGDWYVVPADPGQVFDPALDELWNRLVQDHEGLPIWWSVPPSWHPPTSDAL